MEAANSDFLTPGELAEQFIRTQGAHDFVVAVHHAAYDVHRACANQVESGLLYAARDDDLPASEIAYVDGARKCPQLLGAQKAEDRHPPQELLQRLLCPRCPVGEEVLPLRIDYTLRGWGCFGHAAKIATAPLQGEPGIADPSQLGVVVHR